MDETTAVGELPPSLPPLCVDIDGTLTDDRRVLDPRAGPILRAWPSPVVIATGKAMPYAVALCEFAGIEPVVVAENGGVALVERRDSLYIHGDREAPNDVRRDYRERGHDLGWGQVDLVNRWRETELAVSRDAPLEPLVAIANEHGLDVVDTGYAYHVKSTEVDKAVGLEWVTEELERDPADFAAVGDSTNDVPAFDLAGTGIAVGNADEDARAAADHVTDGQYGAGFIEAIEWLRDGGD